MTQEEFNDVFEIQMKKCSDILTHKKSGSGRYDVKTCRIHI